MTMSPSALTRSAPGAVACDDPAWHLVASVVLPDPAEGDTLPLYVESGLRAARIDDKYDRNLRGWGDYKGVEARAAAPAIDLADVRSRRQLRVPAGERASFATYFNAFPASYWRRWTAVDRVRLDVTLAGQGSLVLYRSNARGAAVRVDSIPFDTQGRTTPEPVQVTRELDLVPFADGGWYWFDIVAGEAGALLVEADWSVHGTPQRPATLSIGVTTVNKVDYVDALVATIAAAPTLRGHLDTLYIVDQGSVSVTTGARWAASAADLGEQLVHITQANLGGSGGFSRGMYETLTAGRSTFHLVLDDDVRLEPEGIVRAVRFGAFTRVPTIVGGHMFDLNAPTTLHSFGEVVDPVTWTFAPVLGVHEQWDLAASGLRETPWLHRRTDVAYNGWWMCLIPTQVLAQVGLSLPVFIKWDDSEHCLRAAEAGFPTVSLPGAAVWHVSWEDKDDLWEWQAYFHQRNLLISALLHSRQPRGGQAIRQSVQWLVKHLYSMRYYAVEMRLRGLRDLLAGPDRLHDTLGTTLPQLRAASADFPDSRSRPSQADFPAPPSQGGGTPRMPGRAALLPWVLKTGLRQLRAVPEGLRDQPQRTIPSRYAVWWFLSQYDSAIVSKSDGTAVAWYERDRELFLAQLREGVSLHWQLYREWDDLAERYQRALPELVSAQAWARTFGLEEPARQ